MMAAAVTRQARLTIRAVAAQLGVAPKTIHNLLSEHRAQFVPRVYGMGKDGRVRLLSPADVQRLASLLWVRTA
jgi:hypothetical protein